MKQIEIKKWGRWHIAWLSRENFNEVASALKTRKIDGVGLSPHHGFDGDFEILNGLPVFWGIVIIGADELELSPLVAHTHLRFLTIDGKRTRSTDFNIFPHLQDLKIDWIRDDVLPSGQSELESLCLYGFKPKTGNLISLPEYPKLVDLELVRAGVTSLVGVERQKKLRKLDMSYCKGLVTIEALVRTSVEYVHLEACGKIEDIPSLSLCPRMKSIRLSSCGNLRSLDFLRTSKTIEEFRFVKMEVADGDMTPLLELKSVGFIDKRGYSHTYEQVRAIIAERMAGSPSRAPRS